MNPENSLNKINKNLDDMKQNLKDSYKKLKSEDSQSLIDSMYIGNNIEESYMIV